MAQIIDIRYQEKAESQPLNKRFLDITGPCILQGFRTVKGTKDFTLTLERGEYTSSVAIAPSGVKIEETTTLTDVLTIASNPGTERRVDSIYLKYQFGMPNAKATYEVVRGTTIPANIPNRFTHLLLAYVYVPPYNGAINQGHIVSMPYGFSQLTVAGHSMFNGSVVFNEDVTFKGKVLGGLYAGNAGEAALVQKLPYKIIAAEGQTDFELHRAYAMNSNTLFVYKNGLLIPPNEWVELTNASFRFLSPLKAGDEVWAFWYMGLNVYDAPEHNHDELYFRKNEVMNRTVRYVTDYFAGTRGRTIRHSLNTDNYVIIAVTPTEKTEAVGEISVEKRENEIVVYNSGTYRGKFDLSYMMKQPFAEEYEPYEEVDCTIESNRYNQIANVYEETIYRRKSDGKIHLRSLLTTPDSQYNFTRLELHYYNSDGTEVKQVKTWALTYDNGGKIKLKTRIN